jgi:hypothetical protein
VDSLRNLKIRKKAAKKAGEFVNDNPSSWNNMKISIQIERSPEFNQFKNIETDIIQSFVFERTNTKESFSDEVRQFFVFVTFAHPRGVRENKLVLSNLTNDEGTAPASREFLFQDLFTKDKTVKAHIDDEWSKLNVEKKKLFEDYSLALYQYVNQKFEIDDEEWDKLLHQNSLHMAFILSNILLGRKNYANIVAKIFTRWNSFVDRADNVNTPKNKRDEDAKLEQGYFTNFRNSKAKDAAIYDWELFDQEPRDRQEYWN